MGQRVPRGKRDKKDGGGEYLFFNACQIFVILYDYAIKINGEHRTELRLH